MIEVSPIRLHIGRSVFSMENGYYDFGNIIIGKPLPKELKETVEDAVSKLNLKADIYLLLVCETDELAVCRGGFDIFDMKDNSLSQFLTQNMENYIEEIKKFKKMEHFVVVFIETHSLGDVNYNIEDIKWIIYKKFIHIAFPDYAYDNEWVEKKVFELFEYRLFPTLSLEERQLDFESHIKELQNDGRCYFLPFRIEKIRLKNIGIFDDVEIFFDKDVNIIFGRNATGKTTIIRSLAKAFGFFGSTLGHFLKHGKDRGKIKIRVSKERNLVIQYKLSGGDVEVREHIKSMLLDEPADLLDQRNKREFIEWVKERFNCQIIIATHDKNMVDIGDKVISQN